MDANELRSLTHNRLADADNAYCGGDSEHYLRRHPDGLTIREIARLLGVTYEEAALVLRAAAHLIDQRAQLEAQP